MGMKNKALNKNVCIDIGTCGVVLNEGSGFKEDYSPTLIKSNSKFKIVGFDLFCELIKISLENNNFAYVKPSFILKNCKSTIQKGTKVIDCMYITDTNNTIDIREILYYFVVPISYFIIGICLGLIS